jgi:UDP-N-acetylmuramate dehydrogenase
MQVEQSTSLLPYNTFGVDAKAQFFASFGNIDELKLLLEYRKQYSSPNKPLPLTILGGGSNILLTKDVEGLVLKNELKGIALINEDEEYYYISASAGEVWHELVEFCIANNYAGLENLSLIPGNVGASPMQNIGAYGVEIKDVFYELEAYNINEGSIEKFRIDDCKFGYRESIFKNELKGKYIILNVTYKLKKNPVFNTSYGAINTELERMGAKELNIKNISQAIINIRTSKLPNPKEIGNAGSFFKNPQVSKFRWHVIWEEYRDVVAYKVDDLHYKLAAGWLIEQCGWKGFRKGNAGCHAKQALVLVNYGKATGKEILDLSSEIIQSVKEKFGVELEREVNII